MSAVAARIGEAISAALAPRRKLTVSEWADTERYLTSKESPREGQWVTASNPPLREPMDCMSRGSGVHELVALWPIQFGKTSLELNGIGYTMAHDPCPMIVVLPDDITKDAWTLQKFNPMIENTPAVQRALTTSASRDSANQRAFKDFAGGQLFIEHGKTASRLALRTAKKVFVDEVDKFVGTLATGEDPLELLRGRTTVFASSYLHVFIGSPGIKGVSRLDALYTESDQRKYVVPCPHCGHMQPLIWSGLQWSPGLQQVWYTCQAHGCVIEEARKTEMIRRGHWEAQNPGAPIRGYHLNCLYYPLGMGPRWAELARMWIDAQSDPAKLQVFVQERLAEAWESLAMRQVKANVIAERAESYPLRTAPDGVLEVTAGVDVQDNRLAVHIVGWGRALTRGGPMRCWTLDYDELPGDPAGDEVWTMLTDLLNRPIEHELGGVIRVAAVGIDMLGHRTEAVKAYVRSGMVRRPMCLFGAVQNNAAPLGRPKLVDVNWKGHLDKRGVKAYQIGTVAIKHMLYSWLSVDADEKKSEDGKAKVAKTAADRITHFPEALDKTFFAGMVSEIYNPSKNRFEKRKGGVRNEPLDTWVQAYAAANHPELRLPRRSKADWDAVEKRLSTARPGDPRETKNSDTGQQQPQQQRPVTGKRKGKSGRPGFSATRW